MIDLARHAQVQFGLALVALLVCVGALAWRNVFGRPPAPDLVLPTWLERVRLEQRWRPRIVKGLDLGLAGLAAVLALLFTTMTGVHGQGLDHERVLHEVIQAKYHAELGWERLYVCAWSADRDHEGHIQGVKTIRGLELDPAPVLEPTPEPVREVRRVGKGKIKGKPEGELRLVTIERPEARKPPPEDPGGRLRPAGALEREAACQNAFDEARWDALAADVGLLAQTAPVGTFPAVFNGYGSTASPARLARMRMVFAVLPVSVGSLYVLGLLGGLLVIAALVAVERGFGLRAAAFVGLIALAEFGGSPTVTGATTANALVLAATLAALAFVELEKWPTAGALLAFAALEVGWPAFVLLALVAKLAADTFAGKDRKAELLRVLAGAAGCGALVFLISLSLPGGASNWSIWLDRLALTRYGAGTHEVGLQWMFAPDGSWLGGPEARSYPQRAQYMADRRGWFLICATLLSVPGLLSIRRLPAPAFAAIAGVTATFVWLSTHASAWSPALALVGLGAAAIGSKHADSQLLVGRPTTLVIMGCLGVCLAMHGMARVQPLAPWLFNMIYPHLLTALLIGLGVTLLLLPGLRERGDLPGQPAAIPIFDPATLAALTKAEAKPEHQSKSKAEPAPESEPESDNDPEPDAEAESEPEPESEAEAEPEPEPETESETEPKSESSEVSS